MDPVGLLYPMRTPCLRSSGNIGLNVVILVFRNVFRDSIRFDDNLLRERVPLIRLRAFRDRLLDRTVDACRLSLPRDIVLEK